MMEESLRIQQLLVCILLYNFAVIDDKHIISIPNRQQAMCNHKTRATLDQAQERFLDPRFRARVHAGGGFIQNEDARIGKNSARGGLNPTCLNDNHHANIDKDAHRRRKRRHETHDAAIAIRKILIRG